MKIAADIYPGMFDREYQVGIYVDGQDIYLFVGKDFVQVEDTPSDNGSPGFLLVDIVGEPGDDDYLVALPGEPQGTTSRVCLPREVLLI